MNTIRRKKTSRVAPITVLQTAGGLRLGPYTEVKPLLLLTYLLLHGPSTREELARLLWPDASDARNSLRVGMATLRRWGVQLHQVGTQVSATHPCDATSPVVGTAIWVNRPFLSGVALCGVSTAFEDWAFDQRERLALQVHNALLVNPATQPPCR